MAKLTLFCMLLTAILSAINPISAQAPHRYRYAYLVSSSPTEGQMALVDPTNLDAPPDYHDLNLPADWRPPSLGRVSPDGQWVMFMSASKAGTPWDLPYMRLFNV